jgi:hypothetical protein
MRVADLTPKTALLESSLTRMTVGHAECLRDEERRTHVHSSVLLLPRVTRLLADVALRAHSLHRTPGLHLPQDPYLLFLIESALSHLGSPLSAKLSFSHAHLSGVRPVVLHHHIHHAREEDLCGSGSFEDGNLYDFELGSHVAVGFPDAT